MGFQPLLFSLVAISTGLLVVPLAYLSALSGFCMKDLYIVSIATFGMLDDYGLCSYMHLEFTPLALTILASIHVIASMRLIVYRIMDTRYSRKLIEFLELASYILGFHIIAIAVLIYII